MPCLELKDCMEIPSLTLLVIITVIVEIAPRGVDPYIVAHLY